MGTITIRDATKQVVSMGAGKGSDGNHMAINAIARDQRVLFEDDFRNGPSGWTQLIHGTKPNGTIGLSSEITFNNSPYSLVLQSGDQVDGAGNFGGATAIKRMGRGATVGKLYVEFYWGWGSKWGENAPRAYDFGCDQADLDGNRKYFKIRWFNYDAGNGRPAKYQLLTVNGSDELVFVDIPGANIDHGFNENKRNLHHLEAIFDIDAGVYDGVRVDGTGFGSLAATPNASLREYSPKDEFLAPFKGGFNVSMDIRNRNDTNGTQAFGVLAYARGVLL